MDARQRQALILMAESPYRIDVATWRGVSVRDLCASDLLIVVDDMAARIVELERFLTPREPVRAEHLNGTA